MLFEPVVEHHRVINFPISFVHHEYFSEFPRSIHKQRLFSLVISIENDEEDEEKKSRGNSFSFVILTALIHDFNALTFHHVSPLLIVTAMRLRKINSFRMGSLIVTVMRTIK